MINLVKYAICGVEPDLIKNEDLDYKKLFEVCQSHNLTACVAYALELLGINEHDFYQAKEKAIRKNILLDTQRNKLAKIFDENEIWYMPLKGAILKDWYPKLGMRQMSDNDILIDENARKKVRDIMTDLGFKIIKLPNVDEYFKEPVYNFELHSDLFIQNSNSPEFNYYKNIKERLIRNDEKTYGYHFSNEDFYIYLNAHEYKHFINGGTGVRSLLDTYIFLNELNDKLNWTYINEELIKLGISEYEEQSRNLTMKLFNSRTLTDDEEKQLDFYIFSGTYGTRENAINEQISTLNITSKKSYLFRRLFPPMEHYKIYFSWAYKYKILLPLGWGFRVLRGAFKKHDMIKSEIKIVNEKSVFSNSDK